MDQTILKDVLISENELHRYYEGMVPIDLWRGLHIKKNKELFELVETAFEMQSGRMRPQDIRIENGWVKVQYSPRGISTFDKPGVPKGRDWVYYRIPAGTKLPPGLAVVKDSYNRALEATHYTIAPMHNMPLAVFKKLLSDLAVMAIKEAL